MMAISKILKPKKFLRKLVWDEKTDLEFVIDGKSLKIKKVKFVIRHAATEMLF